jgi:type II secretory pathway pseudopilin PulG
MKREVGFVLIATLLIMVVVAILVFGTMFTTLVDRQVSANQQGATTAYYVAQSGLQQAKTRVFRGLVDHFENADPTPCEESLEEGNQQAWQEFLDEVLGDRGEWIDFPNGENPVGQFRIATPDPPIRDGHLVLIANGRVGNARATVQLIASAGAGLSGAWDNAITAAGRNPNTRSINGNVAVYGSVQIVRGDVEIELVEDLSLQGTAGVYNNYRGKDGTANTGIEAEMARVTGALIGTPEYLPDLCARIKIERGHLIFDDNAARAGTSSIPIYSVHLGEGYGVCRRTGRTCNWITNHHTSNLVNLKFPEEGGIVSPYDGYQIDLPKLHTAYPEEGYPAETSFGGAPLKAWDYLTNNTNDPGECEWLLSGGTVRLPPEDLSDIPSQFHYRNNTLGVTYVTCFNGIEDYFYEDKASVQDDISQIVWSNQTAHVTWVFPDVGDSYLRVHGWVNTGDYPIRLEDVRYEGRGVLRAGRCNGGSGSECTSPDSNALIEAYGEISPRNGGYPANHSLGLISSGDIEFENSPGEVAAVLAFAAGEIVMKKQTLVAGAIVATAFDMGQQVPKIAYHPGVGQAAEAMCMPGSNCMINAIDPEGDGRVGRVFGAISYERR